MIWRPRNLRLAGQNADTEPAIQPRRFERRAQFHRDVGFEIRVELILSTSSPRSANHIARQRGAKRPRQFQHTASTSFVPLELVFTFVSIRASKEIVSRRCGGKKKTKKKRVLRAPVYGNHGDAPARLTIGRSTHTRNNMAAPTGTSSAAKDECDGACKKHSGSLQSSLS